MQNKKSGIDFHYRQIIKSWNEKSTLPENGCVLVENLCNSTVGSHKSKYENLLWRYVQFLSNKTLVLVANPLNTCSKEVEEFKNANAPKGIVSTPTEKIFTFIFFLS